MTKKRAMEKQHNALSRAHDWVGNMEMVKRAVKEAAAFRPLSEIQWHNLQVRFGSDVIDDLRGAAKSAHL